MNSSYTIKNKKYTSNELIVIRKAKKILENEGLFIEDGESDIPSDHGKYGIVRWEIIPKKDEKCDFCGTLLVKHTKKQRILCKKLKHANKFDIANPNYF